MSGFYEFDSPDTVRTTVFVSDFRGDGSTTAFNLTSNPFSVNNTQVYIDGVYQEKTGYSVSGVVLTFSQAPPNLSTIEVTVLAAENVTLATTSADLVTYTPAASGALITDVQTELRKLSNSDGAVYTPAGTGAVATTVQAKLRETVSVMDFGAVGDGVTDDTVAIQAALDSLAITVYFPRGHYLINSQLVLSDVGVPLQLRGDGYLSSRIKCNFSGANILVTKANVEFSGLRFNAGDTAVEPIAVKSALTTNNADCDVWFRDCWFNTGIHIGHDVVGRGSQFLQCTLKCTTVMQITAPNPYVYSGSSPTQPPEGGMRRYKVVDCDIDGITTLVGAPNSTTADKYIHSLIISGNHFNGVDYLIRAQSCIDASIVNNTIGSTKNGGNIEALIAVKYLRDVTITGNYFAGWPNSTIAATGRWNILISATNDPFDFTDVTVLNETLIENVIISGNVLKNLELGIIKSYGNVKRATVIGNSIPEIFEYSNETNIYLINSRTYADIQIVNNSLTTDVANVTGTPTYYTSYGSAGGNGAELTYGNTSDVALIGNDESQLEILPQGLAITGGLLTVEKTNSAQLAVNSTNSNGASFLIKEGGSTVSGVGHFNGIAGLQLSGDGTTEHLRVTSGGNTHAGIDNSSSLGIASRRWTEVFAANGTINTSDERSKEQIRSISNAEKLTAQSLKQSLKAFKFSDAVSKKGDRARIHIGVIAQEVKSIFEDNGLDAHDYSLFCYDEWEAEYDKNGNEINPAGNSFGIRYDELLAFIISSL